MAIKPNDEERNFGDRERQREVSNESGRSARASTGEGAGAGESASTMRDSARGRSNRGFASMDRSKQREIASKGGRAAHQKGTAHEFSSEEAREAGRKGGRAVSQNREHMSAIGREGGESRAANHTRRRSGEEGEGSTESPAKSRTGSRDTDLEEDDGMGGE